MKYRGEDAWRVDATSNFNDETFAEKTIIGHITKSQAERIAAILNEGVDSNDRTYYQARDQESRLCRGMEEFI
jgi:hypothetical protein